MADATIWTLAGGLVTGTLGLVGVIHTAWNQRKISGEDRWEKYYGRQGVRVKELEERCEELQEKLNAALRDVARLHAEVVVLAGDVRQLTRDNARLRKQRTSVMELVTDPHVKSVLSGFDSEPEDDADA